MFPKIRGIFKTGGGGGSSRGYVGFRGFPKLKVPFGGPLLS